MNEQALLDSLALWLARRRQAQTAPLVFGIAGAQGTGKTTLAKQLELSLLRDHRLATARISLDDLYKTRFERERLAHEVHPLLITRGVPGTHDVELGLRLLAQLCALEPDQELRLPRFDKAHDDRMADRDWPAVYGPIDVVLFEGWCLGARPETHAELASPINALEREHDRDGSFRRYVNRELAGEYQTLFDRIDVFAFLAAPDFASVLRWRREQEQELALRTGPRASGLMDAAALERFVQHFERITLSMLRTPPSHAELILRLGPDHRCEAIETRSA